MRIREHWVSPNLSPSTSMRERVTIMLSRFRYLKDGYEQSKEEGRQPASSSLQKAMTAKADGWINLNIQLNKRGVDTQPNLIEVEHLKGKKKEEDESKDNIRSESIYNPEVAAALQLLSFTCNQATERCEQSMTTIPSEQKCASFRWEANSNNNGTRIEERVIKKEGTPNSKPTTNMKGREREENKAKEEESESSKAHGRRGRKKKTTGILMEGSRCSRVNGRGWRCSRQTLVGYALCEHHLGKGRMKSMNNIHGEATMTTPKKDEDKEEQMEKEHEIIVIEDEKEEQRPTTITKKRRRFGSMKARSISSLIDLNKSLCYSNGNGVSSP